MAGLDDRDAIKHVQGKPSVVSDVDSRAVPPHATDHVKPDCFATETLPTETDCSSLLLHDGYNDVEEPSAREADNAKLSKQKESIFEGDGSSLHNLTGCTAVTNPSFDEEEVCQRVSSSSTADDCGKMVSYIICDMILKT